MRRTGLITGAVVLVGGLALLAIAFASERSQAFTLGVASTAVQPLAPHDRICQSPIAVPAHAGFEGVRFAVGANARPGPPVQLSVRDAGTGRLLSRTTLAGGYPGVDRTPTHTLWGAHVSAGHVVTVCLENTGRRAVYAYGGPALASRATAATLNGKPAAVDLNLAFERRDA